MKNTRPVNHPKAHGKYDHFWSNFWPREHDVNHEEIYHTFALYSSLYL